MSKSVILFDDDPIFRSQLESVFFAIRQDFELIGCFADTSELEKNIHSLQPDVVLMDVQMQDDEEGILGLYMIKHQFPQIKVMMLTSFDLDETIFNAICLGADGYMLKSDFNTSIQIPHEMLRKSLRMMFEGGAYMTPSVAKRVLNLISSPTLAEHISSVKSRFQMFFSRNQGGHKQYAGLTKKQIEVLKNLALGKMTSEIAQEMHLTENTINTHIKGIYNALEVHNRTSAIKKAIEAKIIS
ncbi:MAG: response regulator transcription factor [Bacteroidota bacterium]|nr:response regulator transcription factor [Bacteroidota bacterium]